MLTGVDVSPVPWTGRVDGSGPEHLRWHSAMASYTTAAPGGATVLLGFASDEGVRRNKGRRGAVQGPTALRRALGSLALARPIELRDAGDVAVTDSDLAAGQERLGAAVADLLNRGHFVVVLGGGHEVAYGSYLGLVGSPLRAGPLGVLNLDAHFDLRNDTVPSSGTPFRQMAMHEEACGRRLNYAVLGISQPSNTEALFAAARAGGVRYLLDEECSAANLGVVEEFVTGFLAAVDSVYLTIDLDVLPASVAPGVSAPAAYGVSLEVIQLVCDLVAASGKLVLLDVAELNPSFDIDDRTARTAARLIHRVVTGRPGV